MIYLIPGNSVWCCPSVFVDVMMWKLCAAQKKLVCYAEVEKMVAIVVAHIMKAVTFHNILEVTYHDFDVAFEKVQHSRLKLFAELVFVFVIFNLCRGIALHYGDLAESRMESSSYDSIRYGIVSY